MSNLPGSRWRVLAQDGAHQFELRDVGMFDELVVDNWCHLEAMDDYTWWMQLGPLHVWVYLRKDGTLDMSIHRDGGQIGGRVTVRKGVSTRGERLPGEDGVTWRTRGLKQPLLGNALDVSGGETATCYDGG